MADKDRWLPDDANSRGMEAGELAKARWKINDALTVHPSLSPVSHRVGLRCNSRMNSRTGFCNVTNGGLADELGVHITSVKKAFQELGPPIPRTRKAGTIVEGANLIRRVTAGKHSHIQFNLSEVERVLAAAKVRTLEGRAKRLAERKAAIAAAKARGSETATSERDNLPSEGSETATHEPPISEVRGSETAQEGSETATENAERVAKSLPEYLSLSSSLEHPEEGSKLGEEEKGTPEGSLPPPRRQQSLLGAFRAAAAPDPAEQRRKVQISAITGCVGHLSWTRQVVANLRPEALETVYLAWRESTLENRRDDTVEAIKAAMKDKAQ